MDQWAKLERFELKYIIPFSMIQEISDYISIYCDQDVYSQKTPSGYYTVNSLYLDSKNFTLLGRKKDKVSNRFNLRVRSYGSGENPPYFFEVKCKKGPIVEKLRSKVVDRNWPAYFSYEKDIAALRTDNSEYLDVFFKHAITLQAEPKILTQYKRLAFFSTIDDYARVTFDTNLRFQKVSYYTAEPDDEMMSNYDLPSAFREGGTGSSVVLELKSHRAVPVWMLDLIRYFGLNQKSFSKYERSLEESNFALRTDFLSDVPVSLFD